MRIVSGIASGIKVMNPYDDKIRPTTDRMKETLFGSLKSKPIVKALDLFAGCGSLGLEIISNFSMLEEIYFIDNYGRSQQVIKKNLSLLEKYISKEQKISILRKDVFRSLVSLYFLKNSVDLIVADPPYDKGLCEKLLNDRNLFSLAKDSCTLVLEHSTREKFQTNLWKLDKVKDFKDKAFSYFSISKDY